MNGFSNENIKDKLCGGCDCVGFVAKVDLSLNAGTSVLTITDSSTYPTGDSRKVVHITVRDKNAKKLFTSIPAADVDGVVTLDLSTLDKSAGYNVTATVVTTKACISDGVYDGLGVNALAGSLGYWDKDNNAIV